MSCSLAIGTCTNLGPLAGKGGSQGSSLSQDLSGGEAQPGQEHNPGFVRGAADRAPASALWGPGTPHAGKARPWRVAFAEAIQGLSLASLYTLMLSLWASGLAA